MIKWGVPSIVISAPRLLLATFLVTGIVVAGSQYGTSASSPQPLHSQAASATQPATTDTPEQSAPEATPAAAPTPVPPAPKPVVTAAAPHSAAPAPVVTPPADASVAGLTPVDPTPASSGGSTATTPPLTTTSYLSTNWSGYLAAAPQTDYTTVSGGWTVPTATSTLSRAAYDAAWIGIGGVVSNDLIQVGTMNTVSHGHETSSAFYELLPRSATTISSLTIAPGDSMSASIAQTASGQWKITITDTTTGASFATTVAYNSSLSSAEWIEEDPSSSFGSLLPLDTFSSVNFTGASTTVSHNSFTAAATDAQPITLVAKSTRQPIATPSALSADGQSFTVTQTP